MDSKLKAVIISAALAGFSVGSISTIALAKAKSKDHKATTMSKEKKKTTDNKDEEDCGEAGCDHEDGGNE